MNHRLFSLSGFLIFGASIIMSLGTVAERDTGNVFREILGHPSTDNETLGHSRPASARRTPLDPSSSTEL